MWKIGSFATLTGTTVKALRFYQSHGLIRPAHVDRATGYRFFDVAQIAEVDRVRRLRRLGFTVREIRAIVSRPEDGTRLHDALAAREKAISEEIGRASRRRVDIRAWMQRLEAGCGDPPVVTVRSEPPTTVASLRRAVATYGDAEDLFAELRGCTRRAKTGISPAAIWYSCGDLGQAADCEAFVTVSSQSEARAPARVTSRPPSVVATLLQHGPTTTTPRPYDVLREWIVAHGLRIAGPKREVYWRGTPAREDVTDLTEIQFPVETLERRS